MNWHICTKAAEIRFHGPSDLERRRSSGINKWPLCLDQHLDVTVVSGKRIENISQSINCESVPEEFSGIH